MSGREKAYYDMAGAAVRFMSTVPFLHFYSPDRLTGPAVKAHYVTAAFKAGADWQREQGRDDAVMRMLGSIENRLMEMQNAPASGIRQLRETVGMIAQTCLKTSDAGAGFRDLHGVVQDAQFELRHMIVDVSHKVDAVLEQVMPKDKAEPATESNG